MDLKKALDNIQEFDIDKLLLKIEKKSGEHEFKYLFNGHLLYWKNINGTTSFLIQVRGIHKTVIIKI